MARLATLNGVIESLPTIPLLQNTQKRSTKPCKFKCHALNFEDFHSKVQVLVPTKTTTTTTTSTRRLVLGLASIVALAQIGVKTSLAEENNGWWVDGPLPGLPLAENQIANKETGTRSFVNNRLYIAKIGVGGRQYRLKKSAFDLMALGDLIGQDAWRYFRKYLKLKATVMYYDFDYLISAASDTDKQPLTDLANRLFDNFEKLQEAVRLKDLPLTEACYRDTTVILQEVMDRMA